jgi:hypothetical protein
LSKKLSFVNIKSKKLSLVNHRTEENLPGHHRANQMDPEMKILIFSYGPRSLRYKFRIDATCESLETSIQEELGLPEGVHFSLIDLADNTLVSIWSLSALPSESHVQVKLQMPRSDPTAFSPPMK